MPKRSVTIDDLFRFKVISDPQVSPDGTLVTFVQTELDLEKNVNRSHIWLVPTDGSAPPRQFTSGEGKDRAPRWSPDGRWLAFTSNRDKQDQLYLISVDGGEARQLTSGEGQPGPAVWSPAGTMIAYTAKLVTDNVKKQNGVRDNSDVKSYTRLNYKADSEGFWDYGWRQIFVIPLSRDTGELQGAARQLTRGNYNHNDPAWSPDSRTIAFSANRTAQADETNVCDIWLIPVVPSPVKRGRARVGVAPKKMTTSLGPAFAPAFSPDGRWIAYIGHDNRFSRVTQNEIWIIPRTGGKPRSITHDFDHAVGDSIIGDMRAASQIPVPPRWSKDGQSLFFVSTDGGASNIYAAAAKGGQLKPVTRGMHQLIGWSCASRSDQLAYVCSTFTNPNDLYICRGDGSREKRLTQVNEALLDELRLSQPSRVEFQAQDGGRIEGWVMRPMGFRAGKKYPTILSIHGGPHGSYGATYFHEFQLMCVAGYSVLFTNPRGSGGYGQDFLKATYHDWGGGDYRDLMAALDGALKKIPWMDAKRLGVSGGSYGGYMTCWVVTHTDRFKVAITERALTNWYSFHGTSDIGSYFATAWEVGGRPWSNPEEFLAHSPITHVANCKTPTLVIHSEKDFRCPIEQAEQFYMALKNLHVPTQFVRFPDETHDLSRSGQPKHRKERLERIFEWYAKHF